MARRKNKRFSPKLASRENPELLLKEKKKEKFYVNILIFLCALWVFHYLFIWEDTIGGDSRFLIFIAPIILGLFVFGIFYKTFLLNIIFSKEHIGDKLEDLLRVLIVGVMFSYLSFGLLAEVIWNQMNIKKAESNLSKYFRCDISYFYIAPNRDTSSDIRFYFKGRKESIEVSSSFIKDFEEVDPDNYKLVLEVKEGLWGHYIIQDWEIEKTRK